MPTSLYSLIRWIENDPGLNRSISDRQIAKGVAGAREMNEVLMDAIRRTGVNDDGLITAADMARISRAVYDRPAQYVKFLEGHGNDNGDVVSGFHYVQNDGGTLIFQGRDYIDTVADAIYHFGFRVENGRFVNEDGAANETTADVAGWLNFFLNDRNVVFGGKGADTLYSGDYSRAFKAARNETFYGGDSADKIWAGNGNDIAHGEAGADTIGAGTGRDRLFGGIGADRLSGEEGKDRIFGGAGSDLAYGGDDGDQIRGGAGTDDLNGGRGWDRLWGEEDDDDLCGNEGNDRLFGGAGRDSLNGNSGDDRVYGGTARDTVIGSDGNDLLSGGAGDDSLSAGSGRDRVIGGTGADEITLWEEMQVRDVLVFRPGDSGRTAAKRDVVEGFSEDHDKIDLSAFGGLAIRREDYASGGKASAYFDGTFLRIDSDGDRATDMMIEFKWVDRLTADDFIL